MHAECCIYHRPRAYNESDSEQDTTDEEDESDGENAYESMKRKGRKPRRTLLDSILHLPAPSTLPVHDPWIAHAPHPRQSMHRTAPATTTATDTDTDTDTGPHRHRARHRVRPGLLDPPRQRLRPRPDPVHCSLTQPVHNCKFVTVGLALATKQSGPA